MAPTKAAPAKKKAAPRKKTTKAIVKPEPEALQAVRSSMIAIPIGNRYYDVVHNPSCGICTHPARMQIEERILLNEGYTTIAAWTESHDEAERLDGVVVPCPTITATQLAHHFRGGHCPVTASMLHDLQAERTKDLDYEHLSGRLVDHVVFAKQTIADTQARVVRGEIKPGYREGLAAAKLVAAVELAAAEGESEDRSWFYEQAFSHYFESARKIMTDAQWAAFSNDLTQNPVLRQLTEKAQNIQDAEVVEETA